MADKYTIEENIDELEFDPDSFGKDEFKHFLRASQLPASIKFYGIRSQLKRLRDRFSHWAESADISVTSKMPDLQGDKMKQMIITLTR